MDQVTRIAVERAEQMGIIFIDEIDKVAGRESGHGPDVTREGVQRDILPIIEGTTVNTRYGMIRTDHILFIAAGAFHVTKPSDLIPELQGRLPIRVELQSLKEEDFIRILTEPKNALIKQYVALLETEGIKLNITDDAVATIARFATTVNEQTENIGARRLHTILEKVLDELSFEAPDLKKKERQGRCRLREQAARRHREESGFEPLHSVEAGIWTWKSRKFENGAAISVTGRSANPPRQPRFRLFHSVSRVRRCSRGCGAPGEPQPPSPPIPAAISDLTAHQQGNGVQLVFTLPATHRRRRSPRRTARHGNFSRRIETKRFAGQQILQTRLHDSRRAGRRLYHAGKNSIYGSAPRGGIARPSRRDLRLSRSNARFEEKRFSRFEYRVHQGLSRVAERYRVTGSAWSTQNCDRAFVAAPADLRRANANQSLAGYHVYRGELDPSAPAAATPPIFPRPNGNRRPFCSLPRKAIPTATLSLILAKLTFTSSAAW